MNHDMRSESVTQAGSKKARKQEARHANRDPITKAPGSHPVGTGIGTAVGGAAGAAGAIAAAAATGAAAGTALGPIGTAAGLVVGAVVGAAAGHAIGEKVNPTAEVNYWRTNYSKEPYYSSGYSFDDYRPAYRVGYEGYGRYQGRSFDDVQRELETDYNVGKGKSKLSWEDAKVAARRAWERVSGEQDGPASH